MVTKVSLVLSRAVGAPVGRRSGGRLATTLVATINVIIHFFSSIFSILGPLAAIMVFAGGAVLQAVIEFPQRC